MIDMDLEILYDVKTKRLNEQVKRNKNRFSESFCFQLSQDEKNEVVAKCDHIEKIHYLYYIYMKFKIKT